MPSTLVHMAIAALVGTALLATDFDRRAIAVVVFAAAVPDLDTFVGLALPGAHRSLLHTLLFPASLSGLLWYDTRVRGRSIVRERYGARGVHVAWVAIAGLLCGGILPDMFTNGVNALYPLHDQFYTVNGKLLLSNQRGIVQTFVDLSPEEPARTTKNLRYVTGVNPTVGTEPKNVERVFPVVTSGLRLLLVLLAAVIVWGRLRLERVAPTLVPTGSPVGRGQTGGDGVDPELTDARAEDVPPTDVRTADANAGDADTSEDRRRETGSSGD